MAYDSQKSTGSFTRRIFSLFRTNPIFLALIMVVYVFSLTVFYLYQKERAQAVESQAKLQRIEAQLMAMERQRFESSKNISIDVFRQLSFAEKSDPQDHEKLQAALSLNSYARYALRNQDLRKARETLDESLRTFPTLEAQYYLGVVNYLEGNNEDAVGSWTKIANTPGIPDDIFIYLSLASYRLGNTEAAKKFADQYYRAR